METFPLQLLETSTTPATTGTDAGALLGFSKSLVEMPRAKVIFFFLFLFFFSLFFLSFQIFLCRSGVLRANVHYYEDGNVQLTTEKIVEITATGSGNVQFLSPLHSESL